MCGQEWTSQQIETRLKEDKTVIFEPNQEEKR